MDMMTQFKKNKKYIIKRIRKKLFGWSETVNNYELYKTCLKGKNGLEIGGPSDIFKRRGLLPIYKQIKSLDGCNFNTNTVWEGQIAEGPGRYQYEKNRPAGYQYIMDAIDLNAMECEKYDFILSSHAVEHIANPLKALFAWLRVLKQDGFLLLVVPHKDGTFDHNRPVTQLQHLINDYEQSIGEEDLSHFSEILELHDLALDPLAGGIDSFRQRSLKNCENRCFHHHVFNADLSVQIIHYFKLKILDVQIAMPFHIIILAQKKSRDAVIDNRFFLSQAATPSFNRLPSDN